MFRTFVGLVYGVALVIASVAVAQSGGAGFETFFGIVGAPFAFFALRVDKIAMVAIPLFWATLSFMAHARRASQTFVALMCIHYGSAILWLIVRHADIGRDIAQLRLVSIFAPGAALIYVAGQILLWREYIQRTEER
jgi:hypothetical protein